MFLNLRAARDGAAARGASADVSLAETEGHTVVHEDLMVVGDLTSDGHVEVRGTVRGTINSRTVTVCASGLIEGTILAEAAFIGGTVYGPVRANNVTVGKTARIVGSVFHNVLTIEPGAYLEGRRPWRPHIDRNAESA